MKKILFASTALLAAGAFASSAQASDPIKLSLGGYMEYYVVAADQDSASSADGTAQGFDVIGDAEVFFLGKTTLDNGMTIGVDVQLEAGTRSSTDAIDESYMYLQGKYGKLIVGSENDVAYKMGMTAPSVSAQGAAGDDDSIGDYLLNNNVTRLMVYSTVTGDANKLSYISPRMYGLQAGVSYTPSNNTNGDDASSSVTEANTEFDAAWAFAANYEEKFSGVGVKVGAAYTVFDEKRTTSTNDPEVSNLNVGASVSYMGFTVGGAYFTQNADTNTVVANSSKGSPEGQAWNVGAKYVEGPYGVSLTYYNSTAEGTVADTREDEAQIWQLAGTYALGKGVSLIADVDYLNAEDEGGAAADGNEGAIGAAVGLKLKF